MLALKTTGQFRKDLKLAKKRGYKLELLEEVLEILQNEEALPAKFKDHPLIGQYAGFRECHIQPDWLLIYIVDNNQLVLTTVRTGTHSDLF
ncbi:type II toxin-antitoxin system YafQ family toxin [Oxalobacter formigenes]|jgi:addiction module toxin, relE/stbE family|uniref:type II toxin-antitoxin system YafQ family toxin n=1 Tax=Oxalobacter formigenes TaxID=847 RepID=UPI0022AF0041|nr:type II toxin-antitoxin system YafQ family toxin [Oxalobacter formigenes]WAW06088.1 type II toxin-antitoxin system YafQ family toxin [Oxalobacter formigenes]